VNSLNFIIFSRLHSYDGGRETWLNNFLPVLKKKCDKYEINIYYFKDVKTDKSFLIESIEDENFKFIPIKIPNLKNKLFSVIRILVFMIKVVYEINKNKSEKKILVGVGSFYESLVLYIVKKLFNSKNITTISWLRGIWRKESKSRHNGLIYKLGLKLEHIFLSSADILISNGKDTHDAYLNNNSLNSEIINNAIDIKKYENIKLLEQKKFIKISFIGRLNKVKGFIDFIESIKIFNENYPNQKDKFIFEVVGDGPLIDIAKNNDIPNLKYIGTIPNSKMISYLETIDCGVALTYSNNEIGGGGVSNALLELMAAKRVIVCWKSTIFTQVLDKNSAILVSENNPIKLAESYTRLLDYNHCLELTKNANKLVENYSIDNHVNDFINLLESGNN